MKIRIFALAKELGMDSKVLIEHAATAGVIASELDEPIHRVVRVLATRPWIKPAALAGRVRLFDRRAIEQVRRELDGIDRRRTPLGQGGAA